MTDEMWSAARKFELGSDLSEREKDICRLVGEGYSNQEIGSKLFITVNTVKTHLKRICAKLSAKNRAHIVGICLEKGLLNDTRSESDDKHDPTVDPQGEAVDREGV